MEAIYRNFPTPLFGIYRTDGSTASHRYYSDVGFMRLFQRNSIEDALRRYHIRFKSQYRCAVYISENWDKYWLEKITDREPDQEDFTITKRHADRNDPECFAWLTR